MPKAMAQGRYWLKMSCPSSNFSWSASAVLRYSSNPAPDLYRRGPWQYGCPPCDRRANEQGDDSHDDQGPDDHQRGQPGGIRRQAAVLLSNDPPNHAPINTTKLPMTAPLRLVPTCPMRFMRP